MLEVVYLVVDSNVRVSKSFESEYLCRKFVSKIKKSKRCALISYPIFG